jgi:hypothetical protein
MTELKAERPKPMFSPFSSWLRFTTIVICAAYVALFFFGLGMNNAKPRAEPLIDRLIFEIAATSAAQFAVEPNSTNATTLLGGIRMMADMNKSMAIAPKDFEHSTQAGSRALIQYKRSMHEKPPILETMLLASQFDLQRIFKGQPQNQALPTDCLSNLDQLTTCLHGNFRLSDMQIEQLNHYVRESGLLLSMVNMNHSLTHSRMKPLLAGEDLLSLITNRNPIGETEWVASLSGSLIFFISILTLVALFWRKDVTFWHKNILEDDSDEKEESAASK